LDDRAQILAFEHVDKLYQMYLHEEAKTPENT
jgi:hypothetical protein